MRKSALTTLILTFSTVSVFAQISGPTSSIRSGAATPALCTPSGSNIYLNRTTPAVLFCGATNTWTSLLTAGGTVATANALKSATTTVNVSAATAPTAGQILTAVDGTHATWQSGSGGGANTALSNLAAVAINTALLPGTDNSLNIGSSGKRWVGVFLTGDAGNVGIQFRSLASGNTNRIAYADSVGPMFVDENVGAGATISLQSLSADRVFTLPNTAGTFALTTSNVATATALAANPTDCSANQFASAIAASGNLTCSQPSAFSSPTISNGIVSGSGFQHQRAASCTTAVLINATCDTTITWAVPFADTNYTAVSTLDSPTGGLVFVLNTKSKTANDMVVTLVTLTAAASAGTINVIAVHD